MWNRVIDFVNNFDGKDLFIIFNLLYKHGFNISK